MKFTRINESMDLIEKQIKFVPIFPDENGNLMDEHGAPLNIKLSDTNELRQELDPFANGKVDATKLDPNHYIPETDWENHNHEGQSGRSGQSQSTGANKTDDSADIEGKKGSNGKSDGNDQDKNNGGGGGGGGNPSQGGGTGNSKKRRQSDGTIYVDEKTGEEYLNFIDPETGEQEFVPLEDAIF